jgi:hypothetical protein
MRGRDAFGKCPDLVYLYCHRCLCKWLIYLPLSGLAASLARISSEQIKSGLWPTRLFRHFPVRARILLLRRNKFGYNLEDTPWRRFFQANIQRERYDEGVIETKEAAEHLRYIPVPPDDDGLVSPAKISAAVERIVALADPVRVIAFGSRARGDHQPHSDLDLAVVVDRYDPEVDRRPVWRSQIPVLMPMDVIVYDVERERDMRDALNSLQWVVAREGVTLYERDKGFNDPSIAERLV